MNSRQQPPRRPSRNDEAEAPGNPPRDLGGYFRSLWERLLERTSILFLGTMKPRSFMFIAGEPSGDLLASELVRALQAEFSASPFVPTADYQPLETSLAPVFFGAGGPCMANAGVEIAFDLTAHSVIGLTGVLKAYPVFRRLFKQLYRMALEREPDIIVCVDFSGFNRRLAHAIKNHVRSRSGIFNDWNPGLVQYVSPQVWASREGRAFQLANDYDLLLSIIPFEKAWYAQRFPHFQVEFPGHPLVDRYGVNPTIAGVTSASSSSPTLLLLPGSREKELTAHLPVMLEALSKITSKISGFKAIMVLANEQSLAHVRRRPLPPALHVQVGGLAEALKQSDVAIASSGTVLLECAYFKVPVVCLYKVSWANYQIAKSIATVKHIAMPNLLANEEIFPEFIQEKATSENIAKAALDLLQNETRRLYVQTRINEIVQLLGPAGANQRAARAILQLLNRSKRSLEKVS